VLVWTWSDGSPASEPVSYDGTEKSVTARVANAADAEGEGTTDDVAVTVTGAAATQAGTCTATATALTGTAAGNYALPEADGLTQTYEISPKTVSVIWTWADDGAPLSEEKTYDGTEKTVAVSLDGIVDGDDCKVVTDGMSAVHAGSHTAKVTELTGDAAKNYTLAPSAAEGTGADSTKALATQTYVISPRTVQLAWSGWETRPDDGTASNVTAQITNLVEGDTCTVTVEGGSASTEGTHTARALALEGESKDDYALAGQTEQAYTITHTHRGTLTAVARKEPTCTGTGVMAHYACSACGKLYADAAAQQELSAAQIVIPAAGHKPVTDPAVEATATTEGKTAGTHCSVCKAVLTPQEVIPKLSADGDPSDSSTLAGMSASIAVISNDGDPAGASFADIQLQSPSQKKNSIRLKWNHVPGATGYALYGNACGKGNRFELITELAGTSYTHTGLKAGTYYKFTVVAYQIGADGIKKVVASARTIHVATKNGKVTNYKKVKANKKKLTLKVKGKFNLAATLVIADKKLTVKNHRKLAYESSDTSVVTVSKKGRLKAVGKGKAIIYIYSQSGTYAKVKVTVK